MSGRPTGAATAGVAPAPGGDDATPAAKLARLPDARLVGWWLALAHASLLAAALIVAAEPALLAGAFYHPRLLAAVHLVALGWISATILVALYLVPGMAMRAAVTPRRGDGAAVAVYALGLAALVASFWLGRGGLAAGGAALLLSAAGWVAVRTVPTIWRSPVALGLRACFPAAFAGLALAAVLGAGLAAGPATAFHGRAPFAGTFAHAHLAALGWVLPVVVGSGYRLLPMLLPAAMPAGWRVGASVGVTFAAAVTLPLGLFLASPWLRAAGGGAALAAVALFVANVGWMVRHRKRAAAGRPRPDLPLVHVAAAMLALLGAAGCGVALLVDPPGAPGLRAAYGILALVGFFGQLVTGVEQRLVAWLLWLRAYTGSGFARVPPTPYQMLARPLQATVAAAWLGGVALLVAGAAAGAAAIVRAGALGIAAGVVAGAALLAGAARAAGAGAAPGPPEPAPPAPSLTG